MVFSFLKNRTNQYLIAIVIGFAILGFWIRIIPMDYLLNGVQPIVASTDPWYTVRQVEQILPHFPSYSWFDPFLNYPTGKIIDWGPVFPLLASTFAILAGASTQSEIIRIISWIPPICGFLLIPICFILGKIIWNINAGWISAMLVSVLGGETLFYTYYGDVDHHIIEVLLTTCFFICYFYLLKKSFDNEATFKNNKSIYALSIITGFLYYLAFMTMPTCSLIALTVAIIAIFSPLFLKKSQDLYTLGLINSIIFGLFFILYAISGIHAEGWAFAQYTPIHLIIAGLLVIESLLLIIIGRIETPPNRIFIVSLGFLFFFGAVAALYAFFPFIWGSIFSTIIGSVLGLGGLNALIQEMHPADIWVIFQTFNLATILALFGIVLLITRLIKEKSILLFGIIIWLFVYLGISLAARRFFYYGGEIVVILTAIALADIYSRFSDSPSISGLRSQKIKNKSVKIKNLKAIVIVGILIGIIASLSVSVAVHVAENETSVGSVDLEMLEGLLFIKNNSPLTNISYNQIYDVSSFKYPSGTYSTLGWWEDGHWILALSHQLPVSSPFLDNIPLVAKFYLSESEKEAKKIADNYHVKYVLTTNDLLLKNLPSMQKWLPQVPTEDPYYFAFYPQDSKNNKMLSPMLGMKSSFFNTTLVKLQVNDGSYTQTNGSVLVEYQSSVMGAKDVPILKQILPLDAEQTNQIVSQKPANKEVISLKYTSPVTDIPALQNYRLIYESNGTRTFPGDVTLNNIKIFERVKGYTIPGTGTIELPIVTNQGRKFTYRQQSVNNTFTLPYPTKNSPYDVHATGPYRIIETNKMLEVDESQIERYYT